MSERDHRKTSSDDIDERLYTSKTTVEAMAELDKTRTSSDDIAERLNTSKTTEEPIRINFDGVESLTKIPGIGEKRAYLIDQRRKTNTNITQEWLQHLIGKRLTKEELEIIDFAPNEQKFTDIQQKRIDKDDTTLGCTDKDDWDICLKNDDIEGIWKLLKGKMLPPYSTFRKVVDKLSTQTEDLKDFCRIISNNLKQLIPGAKIVYPAINPKNNRETFVVLSTCPRDQKYVDGYPVKMKYAYGNGDEDYYVREMQMKEDLCFESTEEENKINAVLRLAHDAFSEWPNYSRISFSFYKSSGFDEIDSNVHSLTKKDCIVLFVYKKQWKPVGWDFFPGHFRGYEIDVRQSMCARKHGLLISSDKTMTPTGTVQGRISCSELGMESRAFALTATHVVLNETEAEKPREQREVYTGIKLKRQVYPVGILLPNMHSVSVTKAILGGSVHVDVALVELSEPIPQEEIPFNWKKLGFTRQPDIENCFRLWKPAYNDIVIKYGITTGVTIGKVGATTVSFPGETGYFEIHSWKPMKTPLSEPGAARSPLSEPGAARSPLSEPGAARAPLSELEAARSPLSETEAARSPVSETEAARSPLSETEAGRSPFSETEAARSPLSETEAPRSPLSETEAARSPLSETEAARSPLSETEAERSPLPETEAARSPLSETEAARSSFSKPGDSGSLVFIVNKAIIESPPQGGSNFTGSDLAVVGLVISGNEGDKISFATHITETMDALGSEYTFDAYKQEASMTRLIQASILCYFDLYTTLMALRVVTNRLV